MSLHTLTQIDACCAELYNQANLCSTVQIQVCYSLLWLTVNQGLHLWEKSQFADVIGNCDMELKFMLKLRSGTI